MIICLELNRSKLDPNPLCRTSKLIGFASKQLVRAGVVTSQVQLDPSIKLKYLCITVWFYLFGQSYFVLFWSKDFLNIYFWNIDIFHPSNNNKIYNYAFKHTVLEKCITLIKKLLNLYLSYLEIILIYIFKCLKKSHTLIPPNSQ